MADQPRQRGRPPLPIEVREQRARKRTQSRAELLRFNRQDDDYREEENARNRQRQAAARAVDAVRIEENFQNAARRRNARAANLALTADIQRRGQNPGAKFREIERVVDAQRHELARQNAEFREAEREVDAQEHRKRRQDEEVRAAEREADAQRHRENRQDDEARPAEQAFIRPQAANYKRRFIARQDPKV